MINKICGEYDEWVSVKDIDPNAEIDDTVQVLYCDTRDFAIGWNFKQPEMCKDPDCVYDRERNKGLQKLINLLYVDNRDKYVIQKFEIIKWLDDLCKETGGYETDWRCLEANVKNCGNWNLKYIRFVRNPNNPNEFIVCNDYMFPIHWKEVMPNIEKEYL